MPTFRFLVSCALALLACALIPSVAAEAKPRTAKIRHVGQVTDMPHSRLSFTLVKQGRRIVKVVNLRVRGLELFCSNGSGEFTTQLFAGRFPDMRVTRAPGIAGFGLSDHPFRVDGFESAYESISGIVRHGGRRASGSIRVRWFNGGGSDGCGGEELGWKTRAG